MIHFVVFFKKETKESIRTYALLIMAVVFAVLGIMNPLVAKLTPELIPKLMPEGINITMPEPSSLDSWSQFFKNIQQMGLVVTMLVFSGSLPNEVAKGTLINLLTKGLSRRAVIFAKYAAMAAIWTLSMAISLVVTWTYTIYFFPDGKAQHVLLAAFWLWTFGAFLLAVMLCAATLVVSSYGSLFDQWRSCSHADDLERDPSCPKVQSPLPSWPQYGPGDREHRSSVIGSCPDHHTGGHSPADSAGRAEICQEAALKPDQA